MRLLSLTGPRLLTGILLPLQWIVSASDPSARIDALLESSWKAHGVAGPNLRAMKPLSAASTSIWLDAFRRVRKRSLS